MGYMLHCARKPFAIRRAYMTYPAARTLDSHHISAVALDLLRKPIPSGRGSANPAVMREWIEKRLASGSDTISGIELHREIEAGIPGKSIPTLIIVLDMTREDFSDLLGRARKTLGDLVQRQHLSRVDSDLLYRIARAIVHAVSVFEDAGYAVQWLKASNEALGGATPLSLLATVEGDEVVHAELGAVEHGMPV
jgi:putative toxin-antitoxin system antitoxin component (TIGR02293 family)